jgi:hypothetical protein
VALTGTKADVEIGLTWHSDRVTRGRGRVLGTCGVWHVTRHDGGQNLQVARGGACGVGWRRFLCG